MAAKPEVKAGDDKAAGGKKRGKGMLIGIIATVVLGGGGGAGWYLTRPAPNGDDQQAAAPLKPVESIFMNLDPFTVNLADAGGDRLAQVAVVIELGNKEAQAALTKQLPVVRNSLLLLISSQQSKTLLSLDGKLALADEIALRTGEALGWEPEEAEEEQVEEEKPQATKAGARKTRKRPRRNPMPNPVVAVHFSQMLIQ